MPALGQPAANARQPLSRPPHDGRFFFALPFLTYLQIQPPAAARFLKYTSHGIGLHKRLMFRLSAPFSPFLTPSASAQLGVVCALLMLLPTAEAESPLVRWVLGGLCFVLLLVLLGGWLSVTPKGSRGSKRCKRR